MVYMVSEPPAEQARTVLTYADLRSRGITLSLPSLWRLEKLGQFPRRFNLSPNRVGWLATEIDEYIRQKVAERDRNMSAAPPLPPASPAAGAQARRRRGRPRKTVALTTGGPPPPPFPSLLK